MATNALTCATCPVRDRAACAALTEGERADLARYGHHRRLKRGEALFSAGGENGLCATLIAGALKISSIDSDGTEHILAMVHPAGFAGELFAPLSHHDVVAVTDSELCVFSRSQYEDALRRYPELAQALLRRSSEDLFASRSLLAAMTRRSALQRVAGFLLAMANAASDSTCHPAAKFDLVLARGEIAAMLGLTIETVSRQLTRLEKDKVIARDGARGIELIDAGRLEAFAA